MKLKLSFFNYVLQVGVTKPMIDYKMPEDVDHMPMGRKKIKSHAWVNKYNFKYIIISAGIY